MKQEVIKSRLGTIVIEEKETSKEDLFVGDIRISFTPNFPTKKNGAKLECFSIDFPRHNKYAPRNDYEFLLSWYKEGKLLRY